MLKKLRFILIAIGILLLSACDFTITGRVDVDLPPSFSISNPTYSTNFKGIISGVEQFIICDNLETNLSYSFNYSGTLNTWTSFLEGQKLGERKGERTFTSADVVSPGRVETNYQINPGGAPRLESSDLTTEAIVVVPKPTVIGYSQLFINVNNFSRNRALSSKPVAVVDNCPVPTN